MDAINLNTITGEAFVKIYEIDQNFINTNNYLGLAYFWAYEYRHYLRDATISQRKKVHNLFLKNGLIIDHASEKHFEIIKLITKQN
jgi:hypothetical protein